MGYYRADGVRIAHDPYAPGMAEKYGAPGATDNEGFDPYADSVGPGIYGGVVKRDGAGRVVIGAQYQSHNPRPGPIYAGGGYTPTTRLLADAEKLAAWLDAHPDLVNEISTGGAQPLHNCGMSAKNQAAVGVLVARGADVEAVDTYGYTPLQRMASNNLAIGAGLLLDAGADPAFTGGSGETAADVARAGAARDVLAVLARPRAPIDVERVVVEGAGDDVSGEYFATPATETPAGFAAVCADQRWDTASTWDRLNAGATWYKAGSGAYIYHNALDGCWWIDAASGDGVFKAKGPPHAPPAVGYEALGTAARGPPASVRAYRAAH